MDIFKKRKKKPGRWEPAVLVLAVKGGTGKTMICREIILALAEEKQIAALDADIDSPNLAECLGVDGWIGLTEERKYIPVQFNEKVELFSTSLYHPEACKGWTQTGDQNQIILRDAAIETAWGRPDIFIVDMPAGSSDEFRAIRDWFHNVVGVVAVTQPNTIPDLIRVIDITGRFNLPILGVVENMVEVECEKCGSHTILFDDHGAVERVCNDTGVPYMGYVGWVKGLQQVVGNGKPMMPEKYQGVIEKIVKVIRDG